MKSVSLNEFRVRGLSLPNSFNFGRPSSRTDLFHWGASHEERPIRRAKEEASARDDAKPVGSATTRDGIHFLSLFRFGHPNVLTAKKLNRDFKCDVSAKKRIRGVIFLKVKPALVLDMKVACLQSLRWAGEDIVPGNCQFCARNSLIVRQSSGHIKWRVREQFPRWPLLRMMPRYGSRLGF